VVLGAQLELLEPLDPLRDPRVLKDPQEQWG
jgi:hypothetical protein